MSIMEASRNILILCPEQNEIVLDALYSTVQSLIRLLKSPPRCLHPRRHVSFRFSIATCFPNINSNKKLCSCRKDWLGSQHESSLQHLESVISEIENLKISLTKDTEDNNTNVCDSLKLLLDNSCCDAHNPTINTLWVGHSLSPMSDSALGILAQCQRLRIVHRSSFHFISKNRTQVIRDWAELLGGNLSTDESLKTLESEVTFLRSAWHGAICVKDTKKSVNLLSSFGLYTHKAKEEIFPLDVRHESRIAEEYETVLEAQTICSEKEVPLQWKTAYTYRIDLLSGDIVAKNQFQKIMDRCNFANNDCIVFALRSLKSMSETSKQQNMLWWSRRTEPKVELGETLMYFLVKKAEDYITAEVLLGKYHLNNAYFMITASCLQSLDASSKWKDDEHRHITNHADLKRKLEGQFEYQALENKSSVKSIDPPTTKGKSTSIADRVLRLKSGGKQNSKRRTTRRDMANVPVDKILSSFHMHSQKRTKTSTSLTRHTSTESQESFGFDGFTPSSPFNSSSSGFQNRNNQLPSEAVLGESKSSEWREYAKKIQKAPFKEAFHMQQFGIDYCKDKSLSHGWNNEVSSDLIQTAKEIIQGHIQHDSEPQPSDDAACSLMLEICIPILKRMSRNKSVKVAERLEKFVANNVEFVLEETKNCIPHK
eukprot:m.134838 g.134838  ORF g.134838 m.134838 type:complete len:655 (+) comp14702_c0_seq1:468-2432(+)